MTMMNGYHHLLPLPFLIAIQVHFLKLKETKIQRSKAPSTCYTQTYTKFDERHS